jgi:hypothetical protein
MSLQPFVPTTCPPRVLIAFPDDGTPPIALATLDRFAFDDHLRHAGKDPERCAIGIAELSSAEFVTDWDRTVRVDRAAA